MNNQDIFKELDSLTGLRNVKHEIHEDVKEILLRKQAGTIPATRNYAFIGNPGTGKSTVAGIFGRILKDIGVLSGGQVMTVTRADLVGSYLGASEQKTRQAVEKALGGILFIDEAYLMVDAGNSDFGTQALGTLVNDMEKMDDLVVIVAGYTEQMRAFFAQNPGVASRIATTIELAPYTVRELMLILQRMARAEKFRLAPDVYRTLQPGVEAHMGEVDFGQGRAMCNVLQHMVSSHAARWSKDRSLDPHLLDAEDARTAMTRMGW